MLTGTTVTSVRPDRDGYVVRTDRGQLAPIDGGGGDRRRRGRDRARVRLPAGVTAAGYRTPDGLPNGGVLVVGAASGVQIAEELACPGRAVTVADAHIPAPSRARRVGCPRPRQPAQRPRHK